MSDKQIKAYLNIIICILAGIMLTITGIIAGIIAEIIKISNRIEEYEKTNLQVHEYILNRIEVK